ncbi:MAG TPA: septum formation family protein [Pseudolysinimonas sp.]|nr:septum formation family protein [Pseudolysinimonas sp.]
MITTSTLSRRVVSGIALALAATTLVGCSLLESVVTGVPEGESDVFAIAVGDCLNDLSAPDQVTSVPIVDCAEPHDSEVFARTDTTSTEFPGDAALSDELSTFCQGDAFTEFVGIPYVDSIYGTSGYFPTQGSWGNGDRELLCTIGDPNGQVTGSLAGIGG